MNKTLKLSLAAAVLGAATLAPVSALTAKAPGPAERVAGEKLDSGLGELPHYRDWSDPTGKAPMGAPQYAQSGQKLDSGLGELPHYRYWSDPSGKAPMGTAQFAQNSTPR